MASLPVALHLCVALLLIQSIHAMVHNGDKVCEFPQLWQGGANGKLLQC